MKTAIKMLIVILVAVNVAFYGAFHYYPAAGAAVLLALGRGPAGADFKTALDAFHRYYKYDEYESRLIQGSRLLQRDSEGFQLYDTPSGQFWEPRVEGTVVVAQLAELEAKYAGHGKVPIRPGDIVLDCGANVGVFTRAALDAGARLVVAIEPAPKNIVCLRRNFAAEIASGRVIVYEKGVWDKEDFLTLLEHDDNTAEDGFVRPQRTRPGPVVPLTTIDNLTEELKLEKVDFIKMDIEGAEQRALAGAQATIARHHPRLEISVNHLPEDPEKVPEIIRKAWPGYRVDYLLCAGDRKTWRIEPNILYFY